MIKYTMRRSPRTDRFAFGILLLITAVVLAATGVMERWNRMLYDTLLNHSGRPAPADVVLLAVDQKSLASLGRWPWPRSLHAKIIDKLTVTGARVIGYDIIFAEPDTQSPQSDQLLAVAIAGNGRVVLPLLHESSGQGAPLHETLPIHELKDVAAALGHIDVDVDSDAVLRSCSLKIGLELPDRPAFSLAMLRVAGEILPDALLPGLRSNPPGFQQDSLQHDYRVFIPFVGPPGSFTSISLVDFLEPGFDTGRLDDAFVLVGPTALGMGDALPTPVSGETVPMSGIEINANILQMLRDHTALTPLSSRNTLLFVTLFLIGVFFVYPATHPRATLLVLCCLVTLLLGMTLAAWSFFHLWIAPAPLLCTLVISYPLWVLRKLESMAGKLFRQKERALVTLNSIGDGVVSLDNEGRIQYMNPVAASLSGCSPEEARGRRVEEVFPVSDRDGCCDPALLVEQCVREKQIIRHCTDGILLNRSGRKFSVRMFAGPIQDRSGGTSGVVLGISDITETREALERLAHQASHDELTGLPNRALLLDRLNQAIFRAQRSGRFVAVLFLDLDNFKNVNDRIGHRGGDQLLREVADRLLGCVRRGDTVARLGGDEFVLLLENLQELNNVSTIVRTILGVMKPPFRLQGQSVFVTSSIGVSVYPENGEEPDLLLQYADTAMYRAKDSGRDRFCLFSRDMNERIQRRLELEQELRQAIARGELELHYQPQVNLTDGRIAGVEALLRWKHGDKGYIAPGHFIPVAEECGLIVPIGEWALQEACAQARQWEQAGVSTLRMAVNLSPRQFLQDDLHRMLNSALLESGLSDIRLELEITEGLVMKNREQVTLILNRFRELGGLVAIDDFGTGYSSLSYLKNFPVDQLKIDRSFIRDIAGSSNDAAITQAIITMAHGLDLEVVAEGVEREEQLAVMRAQRCDRVQGYYFSKPLPAQAMTRLLCRDLGDRTRGKNG